MAQPFQETTRAPAISHSRAPHVIVKPVTAVIRRSIAAPDIRRTIASMEITKTTAQFSYRVEPNPEGGFIARPSDPAMETIEGATREDVQQRIQAKIMEVMGDQFAKEFKFAGKNVTVGGKVSVKRRTDSGLSLTSQEQPLAKNDTFISASTPIVPSGTSSGTVWRVIAALVLLALFAWWLLHR